MWQELAACGDTQVLVCFPGRGGVNLLFSYLRTGRGLTYDWHNVTGKLWLQGSIFLLARAYPGASASQMNWDGCDNREGG